MYASRKNNSVRRKRRYAVADDDQGSDALTRRYLKLREIELRVQREIHEKRQELLAKEESLRYGIVLFGQTGTSDTDV